MPSLIASEDVYSAVHLRVDEVLLKVFQRE